jgi:iron-sulfur cluster repair protein YtfE (RIC family)
VREAHLLHVRKERRTMLHAIGRKQHSEELVDLLLACHGRIRTFIELAIAIGERPDASADDIADGSTRVQRYFSEALPLHVEDEEEGVLPRLHGRSPVVDAALDRMCEEHDQHEAPLRQLLALCASLRSTPGDATARAALAGAGRQLLAALEPHLEAEERVIFPAIRALLTADEQREIVGELRARRQPP